MRWLWLRLKRRTLWHPTTNIGRVTIYMTCIRMNILVVMAVLFRWYKICNVLMERRSLTMLTVNYSRQCTMKSYCCLMVDNPNWPITNTKLYIVFFSNYILLWKCVLVWENSLSILLLYIFWPKMDVLCNFIVEKIRWGLLYCLTQNRVNKLDFTKPLCSSWNKWFLCDFLSSQLPLPTCTL